MLFILSYMKGRAAGTWAMHKIQQVLNPSGMPMMMDKFEAKVDLVFADPNQEATAQQKLSMLQQGANSIDKLVQSPWTYIKVRRHHIGPPLRAGAQLPPEGEHLLTVPNAQDLG